MMPAVLLVKFSSIRKKYTPILPSSEHTTINQDINFLHLKVECVDEDSIVIRSYKDSECKGQPGLNEKDPLNRQCQQFTPTGSASTIHYRGESNSV